MFQAGDKIVHPMHGAGVIEDVVAQKVSGVTREYYTLRLSERAMLVMIPVANCGEIGVRAIVDGTQAAAVLDAFAQLEAEQSTNWNRRYRENMERLKSGQLLEVAKVVKGLSLREKAQGLSTGERKMLHSARQIMVSEIVLATGMSAEAVERRLADME